MKRLNKKTKFLLFTISFLLQSQSHALLNMKDASYSTSSIDFESKDTHLKITRVYNSRSLHNGLFGFGWCSQIETHLVFINESNLKLFDCESGREYIFIASLDAITAKKNSKNLLIIYTNTQLQEFITYRNSVFTLHQRDGKLLRFNKKGQLVFVLHPDGHFQQYKYRKGQIKIINDSDQKNIFLSYFPHGKIKIISFGKEESTHYKYNREDLISITGKRYLDHTLIVRSEHYAYDNLHNLIKVTGINGEREQITYQPEKDWVLSHKQGPCLQQLEYKLFSHLHYKSLVKTICNNKFHSLTQWDFIHQQLADGNKFLSRVKINKGGQFSTYSLSP